MDKKQILVYSNCNCLSFIVYIVLILIFRWFGLFAKTGNKLWLISKLNILCKWFLLLNDAITMIGPNVVCNMNKCTEEHTNIYGTNFQCHQCVTNVQMWVCGETCCILHLGLMHLSWKYLIFSVSNMIVMQWQRSA